MKRDAVTILREWRNDPLRAPLLIRGARQVGKSWLIDNFSLEFKHYVKLNLEKDKRVHSLFSEHINIEKTLEELHLYTGKQIVAGETLLFLDEIQECEQALRYLRYFKEEYPELHVIAAGSLIEFTLEKVGMAVGRIDNLFLYPLSFMEFLTANERDDLRELILQKKVDSANHAVLLEYLKNYMWLGGMPAVVDAWLAYKDSVVCQRMQDRIIQNYEDDFQKYAKSRQIEYVEKVFRSITQQLGCKFKYVSVDPNIKTYPIKQALSLLHSAGIAHYCYHSSGQSYPLGAEININRFKVFFFDIGIAHRLLGLDLAKWVTKPMEMKYLGSSAEQFVAQEFIAYSPYQKRAEIFYWHNEARSSNAEVDFIIIQNGSVIPVEVKSGIKGGMKSMHAFLSKHVDTCYGLKISEGNFGAHGDIKNVPLYAIASLA